MRNQVPQFLSIARGNTSHRTPADTGSPRQPLQTHGEGFSSSGAQQAAVELHLLWDRWSSAGPWMSICWQMSVLRAWRQVESLLAVSLLQLRLTETLPARTTAESRCCSVEANSDSLAQETWPHVASLSIMCRCATPQPEIERPWCFHRSESFENCAYSVVLGFGCWNKDVCSQRRC